MYIDREEHPTISGQLGLGGVDNKGVVRIWYLPEAMAAYREKDGESSRRSSLTLLPLFFSYLSLLATFLNPKLATHGSGLYTVAALASVSDRIMCLMQLIPAFSTRLASTKLLAASYSLIHHSCNIIPETGGPVPGAVQRVQIHPQQVPSSQEKTFELYIAP